MVVGLHPMQPPCGAPDEGAAGAAAEVVEGFPCRGCGESFPTSRHRAKHMRKMHPGLKLYACSHIKHDGVVCRFETDNMSLFARHIDTHKGIKPYKCKEIVDGVVCTYAATQTGALDAHILAHRGIKPFKCTEIVDGIACTFAAIRKGNLDDHIRAHRGIKPFKCTETVDGVACTFAATRKCILDDHIRAHRGIKPFKCTEIVDGVVCTFAATRRSTLDDHMRAHRGIKPFKCTEIVDGVACMYASTQSGHLTIHRERIHDIGKNQCDYCDMNRNTHIEHEDDNAGTVHICRKCYHKATGYTSRIEKRWCEYVDKHLGREGLMGSDVSMAAMGGCSQKRPDRLYGGRIHFVELDECSENQHTGTDYACEQKRISEFYNDEPAIFGKGLVVSHWNPDGFRAPRGVKKMPIRGEERMAVFVSFKRQMREAWRLRCVRRHSEF
jgi:hypothetical protein